MAAARPEGQRSRTTCTKRLQLPTPELRRPVIVRRLDVLSIPAWARLLSPSWQPLLTSRIQTWFAFCDVGGIDELGRCACCRPLAQCPCCKHVLAAVSHIPSQGGLISLTCRMSLRCMVQSGQWISGCLHAVYLGCKISKTKRKSKVSH